MSVMFWTEANILTHSRESCCHADETLTKRWQTDYNSSVKAFDCQAFKIP